jgi:NADPH2:quinone reductase
VKALLCTQFGPPDRLELRDLPSPAPDRGQVVVSVKAASVNFPDVLIIENKYQFKPPLPFSPGSELAGIVKEVGADGVHRVRRVRRRDRARCVPGAADA